MARDLQEVTVGVEPGTFSDFSPLTGGGIMNAPMALVSHRGEFDLDGSGVGDTADTRITMPLPIDTGWQLIACHMEVHTTIEYDKAQLELTVRPAGIQSGGAQLLRFPFMQSDQWDHEVATVVFNQYLPAANNFNSPGADSALALGIISPAAWLFFNNSQAAANPVFWLGAGDATAVTGGSCHFSFLWAGYTFKQCEGAGLYMNPQPRGS